MSMTLTDYYELREKVQAHPGGQAALSTAAARVYAGDYTGNLQPIAWMYFGDKPLFARARAVNNLEYMWLNKFFPNETQMAALQWEIKDLDPRKHWMSDERYKAVGADAAAFNAQAGQVITTPSKTFARPKVAMYRLYRMRGIAEVITSAGFMTAPAGHLSPAAGAVEAFTRATSAADFAREVGYFQDNFGIPITTAFHALTDFGAETIKPDVHATNTLMHYGSVRSRGLSPLEFLGRSDANKTEVVAVGVDLARRITPLPEFTKRACREVDIVLLWGSLGGLLP